MERSHTKLFLALTHPEVAAARTGRQSVSGKKRSSLLQSEPLAAALLGGAWSGPTRPAATVQHKLWSGVTQLFLVLDDEYQRLVKEHLDPIFGASRLQQMNEMAGGEERVGTITGDEKTLNRSLGASVVIVGTALVAGGAIAPIVLICFPLAIYTSLVPLKRAYRALFYERKLKIPVLASISLLGTWLGGFYLAGGVGSVIFFVAEKLIFISQDRSRQKLVSILGQQPRFVWILVNESEVEIPFGQLKVGDVLVVGAGQLIPVDGLIRSGHGLIDQHRLTGESQPAEKAAGDQVMAGTVVLAGRLYIAVEKAGSDTIAAQIGHALNNTASYQMAIDSQALQLANASVPPTLIAAGLAWLWIGLEGAVSITGATFGFNVRLTGPITMLNYLNLASQQGILVKDGRSLELLNQVDTVIFDKTGTLTLDQPTVSHIHVFGQMDETALLAYAAAAEDRQTHPIARAIVDAAKRREVALPSIGAARYEIGYGIQVEIDGHLVQVGSERFMAMKGVVVAGAAQLLQADTHDRGHSLVMVAVDDELVGALELEPMVRPEARAVIEALQRRNVEVYIISGDHEEPTRQLAWELGVEHYFANVLPADKAKHVERLQGAGRHVCFVGDGINDSIALKKAQVSVSLRGATTVATDTAQVVLMSATLEHLPSLFALAQQFDTNMKAGLAISIFPSLLIIGGVFFGNLGLLGATILYDVGLLAGVGNDQPVAPFSPLWGGIPPLAYDVEKAKALLAEAGYPDGLEITLDIAEITPGILEAAVVLQETARPAGFTLTLNRLPANTYWVESYLQTPFFVGYWDLISEPDTQLSFQYLPDGFVNESGWSDPRASELIAQSRGERDLAVRRQQSAELQQIISQDGGVMIPYSMPILTATSEKVHGVVPSQFIYPQFIWMTPEQ